MRVIIKITNNKKMVIFGVILTVFIVNIVSIQPLETNGIDPLFTLVFKTNGGGQRPDYGNMLKQYLARIGIDVNVIIQDWPTFIGELIAFRDFDICYVGFSGGGADPDFTGVYDENGSLNLFGYDTSMDWDDELNTGINEWYMKQGTQIMPPNSQERIQHYWNWEQYLMDKICPMLPMVSPRDYYAIWSELEGYNCSKGVLQSWGDMYWTDSHKGQHDTNELVLADNAWMDLNPLFQDDTASAFISSACMDPLLWYDSDGSVWPHLAKSFTFINDTTLEIVAREGIKWADDFEGNFTNEYFDIRDVYFTIYGWLYTHGDTQTLDWIEDMEIIDDMTMRFYIDGDDTTPENEPYTPCLESLAMKISPEHYLNQTQEINGVTPDIGHPSWNIFATHCFGTGLFQIDSFSLGEETILEVRPDSWWVNDSITSDPDLDWERRFGDFTNYLDQLRVSIIPIEEEALSELKAGYVDLRAISNSPVVVQEYSTNPDFAVQNDSTYALGFYAFNMRETRPVIGNREPYYNDHSMSKGLRVRKAICYAINKNEVNRIINGDGCDVVYWPIYHKMSIWCNPNIIRYDFDIDKAREYMEYNYPDCCSTIPGLTSIISIISLTFIAAIITINYERKKQ
ncbi:MAG TPA: ABC transporter substrate-binding protein [Candidatus Bathyarchaeia archaeon]|nr:ABC transporter substrate-binding protein [Candidatus Bathyarchaeia archaeon]